MRRRQISILLVLLLFFHWSSAQEKLSLNLEEAKEYALNFNKTIKNSDLAILQSQEKIKETIAAGLPQASATTDYSNALGAEISIQFDESAPASKIPIKPTSNFSLQVGQLIFSGSYIVGVQTAKLYKTLSETNKLKTEQEVVSQLIENYYLVLLSEESLKILKTNMENLQSIYKKTEPMVAVGMMEKLELDQLLVQVNSLSNALKSAERNYEMAKNMLKLQLGTSADTEIELTDNLSDIMKNKRVDSSIEASFDIDKNIDYQLMNTQEAMTKKQIDLQKAAYLPTISGYYSYNYKILKPAFDMSPKNMVGLQMNIPIFSSGERRSRVQQSKIDLETMQNSKLLLEDQLSIQYKQLKFNLVSAVEAYETQQKNVEVSREVYKNLKNKYEQGMISSLELTTADNNYLKSESDYLSAMMQVLKAQNDLNTLTGTLKN